MTDTQHHTGRPVGMPQAPAPSAASSYRQRRQQGTEWDAPSGATVVIRELDITDHATIGKLPDHLRQSIYQQIEASAKLRADVSDEDAVPAFMDGLTGEQMLSEEYEIGVALCKLGWIAPQVVDEVSDPDTQIGVDELDARDRRAYMGRVFGDIQQEAQQLSTFHRQPGSGVGSGPDGTTVQPASEQPVGVEASGVLQRDAV